MTIAVRPRTQRSARKTKARKPAASPRAARARAKKVRTLVVTAGPTREPIDPVRYLSNESSGKMGFAIAEAGVKAGHRVILVAGPVHLPTPAGVERVDVVTAREMLVATRGVFDDADALFMCAAVCDWRPKRRRKTKWRKEGEAKEVATLEMVRNPDILATLAKRKGERLVVGFALETGAGMARARAKLERKRADYIVLNDASVLGAERTSVSILGSDGSLRELNNRTKRQVARVLVGLKRP